MTSGTRAGPVPKRLTFAYGRTLVLGCAIPFAALVAFAGILLAFLLEFSAFPMAVLGLVLTVYGILFGISPLLTEHWLTRSRLILRQGWYFRAVIPFSEIESLSPAEAHGVLNVPLGIHRPLGKRSLFVTGGRTNLVTVRLRHPRRFWQSFGLEADEIVFDVTDRPRFLEAFAERRGLLPPIEAHGPDA